MILTPQLRQRIEMLQMTSVELNELIEQEMVANPILEEVQPGEEEKEISDNILDQNSDGTDEGYTNGADTMEASPSDTPMELETVYAQEPSENGFDLSSGTESEVSDNASTDAADSFEEIDFGREFQGLP
jgi:RNA polymerase sigma-54 factor